MLSISLVVLLFACGAFALDGRIVNGENAADEEFPYMLSLRGQNRHGCGASIISEEWVLTAAHCVHPWENRPDLFSVEYGSTELDGGTVLQIEKIIKHEDYVHSGNYPNDVAVAKVIGKFDFSKPNAKAVQLPTPFQNPGDFEKAVLTGWGLNQSGGHIMTHLQKVIIEIFSDEMCHQQESRYSEDYHYCAGVIGGGKGQCSADSGGPLVVDGIQFGIVSWSQKPCASAGHPGIFTRVPKYRDWIRLKTRV